MSAQPAQRADPADLLGELAGSLGFLLRVAQVRAFERFYDALAVHGLRPGEFSAMWVMRRAPGIRQGQLAEALAIKPAHMTKMIRRLEDRGQVRRVIPDGDRRSVLLFLSAPGEAFVETHRAAFLGQDDHRAHGLTAAEAGQLASLLRRYIGIEGDGA